MKKWFVVVVFSLIAISFANCQADSFEEGSPDPLLIDDGQVTLTPFQPQNQTPTSVPTATAEPTLTPTPTKQVCSETLGQVIESQIQPVGYNQPFSFTLYLPPCYQSNAPKNGYPLLTLLHGQNYTSQQWIDIGLADKMDQLIRDKEIDPFIVVMPNETADYAAGLNVVILKELIPYLQEEYLICSGRACNAIGGISRGGGWALTAAFKNPDFFISLGLHSTPTSSGHLEIVRYGAAAAGPENLPRIWVDFGRSDYWYTSEKDLIDTFDRSGVVYDYNLNEGGHDNVYWEAHLMDYLRWYADGWK
ncbi:MAG: alpha/beta hydrolase-fold protein [Anaerolineae bacterium]|jgi:enterochelin esterase-like enzyme|nr:alpha/beta hydrolase-fold protein [Anaerolineae bacterium]